MGQESSSVIKFDSGPLLQDQTRIAKLKSAYNSLIIVARGLQGENLNKIMGWKSFDLVRFDFRTLLQGQMSIVKLKNAYNSHILGHSGLQCETNI